MAEFDLIRRLQETICDAQAAWRDRCVLGIGDDAALLAPPPGKQLAVCTDTLVEGVHFPRGTAAASIGHKALAVNLSDLAAMGAEPAWFFLALTLPDDDAEWLEPFAGGMARLAAASSVYLAGGDVTSGPLNVCITAVGLVEEGEALTRSGGRAGDLVVVSGYPGAAARALEAMQSGDPVDDRDLAALEFPQPRLQLGRALRGLATACIDLSDGLLADLAHVLEASGCGAELDLSRLPCPERMAGTADDARWQWQLSGGDDYELCFTLPEAGLDRLDGLRRDTGLELSVIGRLTAGHDLFVRAPDGSRYRPQRTGWVHFDRPGEGPA